MNNFALFHSTAAAFFKRSRYKDRVGGFLQICVQTVHSASTKNGTSLQNLSDVCPPNATPCTYETLTNCPLTLYDLSSDVSVVAPEDVSNIHGHFSRHLAADKPKVILVQDTLRWGD